MASMVPFLLGVFVCYAFGLAKKMQMPVTMKFSPQKASEASGQQPAKDSDLGSEQQASAPAEPVVLEAALSPWGKELRKVLPVLISQLKAVNKRSEVTILDIGAQAMAFYENQSKVANGEFDLKQLLELAKEMQSKILDMIVTGQSQDITRQRVEHVIEVLEILLDESKDIREIVGSQPPSCLITFMHKRFTMEEERALVSCHMDELSVIQDEDGEKVTLF